MSVYFIYAKAPDMARFKPIDFYSLVFVDRLANASRFFDKAAALAKVEKLKSFNPLLAVEARAYKPRRKAY